MIDAKLPQKIYQSRPSLILNIDNEYMTFLLMDDITAYYKNSAIDMPKRHYLNRFVRDFRQWTEKYVDHMHYTVPLTCGTGELELVGYKHHNFTFSLQALNAPVIDSVRDLGIHS